MVRQAVKSRTAVAALLFLLIVIILLPLGIKGDGTLAGKVRILLHYTLGAAVVLAGGITLWLACGAISREIESRTAHMLLVKPVRRWEVWTGKWAGLLLLNACVVALSGIAVCLFITWHLRRTDATSPERIAVREDILTARRSYRPAPEDVTAAVRARIAFLESRNAIPEGTCYHELGQQLTKDLRMQQAALLPGRSRVWHVDLSSATHRAERRVQLRFRLAASVLVWLPVSGRWEVGPAGGPPLASFPVEKCSGGSHVIDMPTELLREAAPWTVRFVNGQKGKSGTAVFDMESPVELLVSVGTFEANLLRALLIAWGGLALVAAVGLTTSALFSSPVSGFVACAVLVMASASHFFSYASADPYAEEHHHHEGCSHEVKGPSALLVASQRVARLLDHVVAPTMGHTAFSAVADGILVSWVRVGRALALLVVVYPLAFGLLAGVCLGLREVAALST